MVMVGVAHERILLIADRDRQVAGALQQAMPSAQVTSVASIFDGVAELAEGSFTTIFAAAGPIERRPEAAVKTLRELAGDSRLLLFGHPTLEPLTRKMLDFGVDDYVVTPVKPAELDGRKLALDETVGSLKAKGIDFDSPLPADAPALLIAADEPDGVHWRVGYNNFYAITRYNHSALYAMAVYELAGAVKQQVLATDAQQASAPSGTVPGSPLAAGTAPPGKPP